MTLRPLRDDTVRSAVFDAVEDATSTPEGEPGTWAALRRDHGDVAFLRFAAHPLGLFERGDGAIEVAGRAVFAVGPARGATEECDADFVGRMRGGRFVVEDVSIEVPG